MWYRSQKRRHSETRDTIVSEDDVLAERFEENRPRLRAVAYRMLGSLTEALSPAERLAFVLHDMFAVSFDEIALIVGRSPAATRQLASRARRRVQADAATPDVDVSRQREIVDAFLAAARSGEFTALLTLLDPDVVMRADSATVQMGASSEVHGSAVVAGFFSGRAHSALPALIDGAVGAVVAADGQTRIAIGFTIADGRIIGIDVVAEPEQLRELEVAILNG
jgi:hypothetical protein